MGVSGGLDNFQSLVVFFLMVPLKFQDAVLGLLMLLSMVLEASKLKIIGSVYIIPVVCMSSVQSDIIG